VLKATAKYLDKRLNEKLLLVLAVHRSQKYKSYFSHKPDEMKKAYLNILVLFSITFLSCEKKDAVVSNNFIHKWHSLDGQLTVNSNNTFEYSRNNCISKSISKGKWKITNDTLVLNSFQPKGCYFIESFVVKPAKDTISSIVSNYSVTIKNCKPNTGYVVLKNEKFYITDSLLISKTSPYIYDKKLSEVFNFKRRSYK
jgi:hypothetical protein